MTASDTLAAYEHGLITENEAVEQVMADDIDDLYERALSDHADDHPAAARPHADRRA